jgi:hypoxanthine phosphoribosyltransferase
MKPVDRNIAIEDMKFRVMISEEELQKRVAEIANQISRDYAGKNPILVGVLNGAFMFLADLMKYITIECEVDFIKISSYGDEMTSSGEVKMRKDYDALVHNRHVLIVEDIVDSGVSISFLREKFELQNTASTRFVSLLLKEETARLDFELDYVGFRIPSEFVIGYGLDFKQNYRNLPAIYVLDQQERKE